MYRKWRGKIVALTIFVSMASPLLSYEMIQEKEEKKGQVEELGKEQNKEKSGEQGKEQGQAEGKEKGKEQDKKQTQTSKSSGVTEGESREPSVYEDSIHRLKYISEQLNLWKASLADYPWLASTPKDVALLEDLYKKLEIVYNRFPTPDGWPVPVPGKKLESQAYQVRDKASAVMFEYLHFRALLDSKSQEVRQKMLEDKLANMQNSSSQIGNIASYLRDWHIGITVILFLLLGFLGFWGYESLRKKIAAHGLDVEGRINQHHQLSNELKNVITSAHETNADKIISSVAELIGQMPSKGKKGDSDFELKLPPPKVKSAVEKLVDLYNNSARNNQRIGDFRQLYRIIQIGVKNADDRAGNPKIAPIFGTADPGDFYAIEIVQNGQRTYEVVPRFGFIFSETKYNNAGLSHVFKCNPDAMKRQGDTIIVKQPARFEPDPQGQIWGLVEQGEIDVE